MILNYQSTKNKSIRPDVISFTSVIKAYVDHPDGGNKGLEMLNEMNKQVQQGNVKAQPDAKTIAIAMEACAKSDQMMLKMWTGIESCSIRLSWRVNFKDEGIEQKNCSEK